MSIDIEAADVIRLIEQFLKEQKLHHTLHTLQGESQVTLNTVDNADAFAQDILQGRWDVVLKTLVPLQLPLSKLMPLYEQIALELIEMREIAAARNLVRSTDAMQLLKERQPERYLHLEQLLGKTYFDAREAYPEGTSKEKRRQALAQSLGREVTVVPPSRLLTLLGQALKWQQYQGLLPSDREARYDLFRGTVTVAPTNDDLVPTQCYTTIQFPKDKRVETAIFSPDGQSLVTGSGDGFIEVWNTLTGKRRSDLRYQAEEQWMSMRSRVLCLSFSPDGELLASGDQDGRIKVWTIHNGQCARRFPAAHAQGVTTLCFNHAGNQLLSGSFDQTVRLHGLKSGKMLKEYRGHTSFINSVRFTLDFTKVLSASSDGTVRVWDYKSCDCLASFIPHANTLTAAQPHITTPIVQRIALVPQLTDQFIVCPKLSSAMLVSLTGETVRSFDWPSKEDVEFLDVALSPHGQFLYVVGTDKYLHCFYLDTGRLVQSVKLGENDILGFVHHPLANILAVYNDAGHVSLWRPETLS
ncbi:hypothetical protein IWQ61_003725 [Dispira simplex]|nr:hypothetical protein IWQ61_003725 [Dispira simplex]